MISTLATWYIFAGGMGAGALFWACLLDCVRWPHWPNESSRTVTPCMVAGFALMLLGVAFLLADLGRIDRVLALFLHPTGSYISIGAWALLLALIGAVATLLARGRGSRVCLIAAELFTMVVAVVVMVYTGLLLQTMVGVALWKTWLVPALFVASSLSCGCAVMQICALVQGGFSEKPLVRRLCALDLVLIAAEAVFAAFFVMHTGSIDNSSMAASRAALLPANILAPESDVARLWWLGFGGLGVVLPAFLEIGTLLACRHEARRAPKAIAGAAPLYVPAKAHPLRAAVIVAAAVCVIVGALCLRFAVVDAGAQRNLELMDSPALSGSRASLALPALSGSASSTLSALPSSQMVLPPDMM